MKKRSSVFGKLFLVFLGTMIVTALVLGLMGSLLYKNFFLQERTDAAAEQGRTIASLISDARWDQANLDRLLKLTATTRTFVFVYDNELNLVASAPKTASPLSASELNIVRDTLRGQEQIYQYSTSGGHPQEAVEIGIPIRRGPHIIGVVVMQALGFERHFGGVYQLLIYSGITAVLFTSIMAFFFSRSIARPLQEMSMIARRMAKGDFRLKAKVRSRDEVGELAMAFNHMAEELGKLESMRREFVAHASHELRSPLTSIRGFVQAILDGTIPVEEATPFLERIHRESQRLGNLVDELLTLSSLENEHAEDRIEGNAMLQAAIRDAAATLQPLMQEKNIRLEMDLQDVRVRGQEERIMQIVINLLSNAIKYSHEDGLIKIRLLPEARIARVEVTDHGIGIPAEEVERVWERFYKVDKARSVERGGTGLGLAIAKRIAEMYGGQVGLTSEWGRGTTAWFTLPLVKEDRTHK